MPITAYRIKSKKQRTASEVLLLNVHETAGRTPFYSARRKNLFSPRASTEAEMYTATNSVHLREPQEAPTYPIKCRSPDTIPSVIPKHPGFTVALFLYNDSNCSGAPSLFPRSPPVQPPSLDLTPCGIESVGYPHVQTVVV
jgi:hypothetical protein